MLKILAAAFCCIVLLVSVPDTSMARVLGICDIKTIVESADLIVVGSVSITSLTIAEPTDGTLSDFDRQSAELSVERVLKGTVRANKLRIHVYCHPNGLAGISNGQFGIVSLKRADNDIYEIVDSRHPILPAVRSAACVDMKTRALDRVANELFEVLSACPRQLRQTSKVRFNPYNSGANAIDAQRYEALQILKFIDDDKIKDKLTSVLEDGALSDKAWAKALLIKPGS